MKLSVKEKRQPQEFGSAVGLFYLVPEGPELWMTVGPSREKAATHYVCLSGLDVGEMVPVEECQEWKGFMVDPEVEVKK